ARENRFASAHRDSPRGIEPPPPWLQHSQAPPAALTPARHPPLSRLAFASPPLAADRSSEQPVPGYPRSGSAMPPATSQFEAAARLLATATGYPERWGRPPIRAGSPQRFAPSGRASGQIRPPTGRR